MSSVDWKKRQYPAGTEVYVHSIHQEPLGVGTLVKPYNLDATDWSFDDVPEIRMPDGRVLKGYDCWWIPVEETISDAPASQAPRSEGE